MTDRIFALTVLLDKDLGEEEAVPIVAAIQMIKRVEKVTPHVSDVVNWAAEARARTNLTQRLWTFWESLLKED